MRLQACYNIQFTTKQHNFNQGVSRQGMFLLDIIQQKNSLSTFKVLVKIFDGNVLWIFLLLLFFFVFLGGVSQTFTCTNYKKQIHDPRPSSVEGVHLSTFQKSRLDLDFLPQIFSRIYHHSRDARLTILQIYIP